MGKLNPIKNFHISIFKDSQVLGLCYLEATETLATNFKMRTPSGSMSEQWDHLELPKMDRAIIEQAEKTLESASSTYIGVLSQVTTLQMSEAGFWAWPGLH
jgi:hypothetical protein